MSDLEWTTVITSTMLMKGEPNHQLWSSGMKTNAKRRSIAWEHGKLEKER
jgi:hypothetical protein